MTRLLYIASNWSRSHSTEVQVAREFESMGHFVCRVPEGAPAGRVRRLVDEHDIELVLFTKAQPGFVAAYPQMFAELERLGVRTASYHLDLYLGLPREVEIGQHAMWKTGVVFTADGDPALTALCGRLGIDHRWLAAACVSDECVPGDFVQRYAHDVTFVGQTGLYHECWPWRPTLLRTLKSAFGDRFHAYGHEDRMRGKPLNDLYASSKVVVGDSLVLPGKVNYWSDRWYETIGRGGFFVGPRVPGIEQHFAEGTHFWPYDIGDEVGLVEQVNKALTELGDTGRDLIRKQGQEHVAAHHTYAHRARTILEEVGLT